MNYIYEPKGRAREYGALALNLYKGCGHRCRYCYVPEAVKMSREEFSQPKPRKIDWRKLDADMRECTGKEVFLSFTCDPYQPLEIEAEMTGKALSLMRMYGVIPVILSKGGLQVERDLELISKIPGAQYGITLTTMGKRWAEWEPEAATPEERIEAVRLARTAGIKTWISFEPTLYPGDVLSMIDEFGSLFDLIKVGKWNHDLEATKIDWKKFTHEVNARLKAWGGNYMLKNDLKKYLC